MSDLIDREAAISAVNTAMFPSINAAKEVEKVLRAVPAAPRWVRCEDDMPKNAKHKGAFCPKLHVLTKWGVTDGWFNPDVGEDGLWCVLLWFFMGTYEEDDIDFEIGDKPRTSWVSKDNVYAWMPIEPPKEDA